MKAAIHATHSGIDGCLRRSRESLFWPGMSAEIKSFISTCEVCNTFQSTNQPETLQPHDLPSRPWEKVGTDLFELNGKDYLVTVDYFSNFWEVDRLQNTSTITVIKKLKAHFARYGVPCVLISDNGPQFTSSNFQNFSRSYDFEHRTSSPYNHKANGKAESAVKTAKALLRKNDDGDHFLALLNHRNTPSQATGTSPAQRFFGRRTRTLLPTPATLLEPVNPGYKAERSKLLNHQKRMKDSFDKHAKDLPPLDEDDVVRLQPFTLGEKKWRKGIVRRRLDDRSYEVETTEGSLLRRNRVHMKKVEEPSPGVEGEPAELETGPTPETQLTNESTEKELVNQPTSQVQPSLPVAGRTRSGRLVKVNQHPDYKY